MDRRSRLLKISQARIVIAPEVFSFLVDHMFVSDCLTQIYVILNVSGKSLVAANKDHLISAAFRAPYWTGDS